MCGWVSVLLSMSVFGGGNAVPGLGVCLTPVLGMPLSSILFEDIGAIEVL